MPPAASIVEPSALLARPDLAEQALEGRERADRYVPVQPMRADRPTLDILDGIDGRAIDQLLFGEAFDVLDRSGDRVWGRARRHGTVGWVDVSGLAGLSTLPTHRVDDLDGPLPFNALVGADSYAGVTPRPLTLFADDPASVAERWLGRPYRAGGRSPSGVDAGGLVQQALLACGLAGPRHPTEQAIFGVSVAREDRRRGDLMIWGDDAGRAADAGVMLDAERVIRACQIRGRVVIDDLGRIEATPTTVVWRRRHP